MSTFFFVITVFSLSYGVAWLGLPQSTMLYCVMISMVFMGAGIMIFAAPSDRLGRRNLALASAGALGLPYVLARGHRGSGPHRAGLLGRPLRVGRDVRSDGGVLLRALRHAGALYSGASLSYALAGVLGGALVPYVAA